MKISKEMARTIIETLRDVIPMDLNFFNSKGVIIASTDASREGSFHEGAKQAMGKGQRVTVEYDGQFQGARRGINVPLCFQEQVVGAIGITGDRETVEPYGTIIKKMTEILLQEEWIERNRIRRRAGMKYWIEGLMTGNENCLEDNLTEEEKFLIVARPVNGKFSPEEVEDIYRMLENYHLEEFCQYSVFFKELVMVFFTDQSQFVEKTIQTLEERVNLQLEQTVIFAKSESYSFWEETRRQYEKLEELLQWSVQMSLSQTFLEWEKLELEKVLCAISPQRTKEFVSQIWQRYSEKQRKEMGELILSYAKHNGSLKEISQELFLHKNTIQYRLNKIAEVTGYNPRNIKDFVILYLTVRMEG